LFFKLTVSGRNFYWQIQLQSFHTAWVLNVGRMNDDLNGKPKRGSPFCAPLPFVSGDGCGRSPLAHRDIRLVADALQCGVPSASSGPSPSTPQLRTAGIAGSTIPAGQIARIAQTTSIRGPALRLQESPGLGFTPPSVPSLRMPGERSLTFASPCAPRVRRWETIPDRLADHTSKYGQVFRPAIQYADTVETRKHRNCRLWIQYLR